MMYNCLKAAIPGKWKRCVKEMRIPTQAISTLEQPFIKCNNRLLALNIVTNKDVYWELVTMKQVRPVVAYNWCDRYEIPEDEWKSIFKNFVNLKESKMKSFQFKIL